MITSIFLDSFTDDDNNVDEVQSTVKVTGPSLPLNDTPVAQGSEPPQPAPLVLKKRGRPSKKSLPMAAEG